MKDAWRSPVIICALVIGSYACIAQWGNLESLGPNPSESSYNLLVEGLRSGQVCLNKKAPPGFVRLADPYDPIANSRFRLGPDRLHDLSYYKGRLYLYFGVTPALILFWPFAALTGEYLFESQAVVIFCTLGFLASVILLRMLWRSYFPEVSAWVMLACALALGLATGVPVLLPRAAYNEVAISCGYMFTMLALGAVWCALHEPGRQSRWLAAASVAYGLAVGARPSLLLGAVVLLTPVAQAWPDWRRAWKLLIAATIPIALIGIGLMLYNYSRFDNPLEFGIRYQLTGQPQVTQRFFSLHYLWFNFRAYFLQPARWSAHFPFVHEAIVLPVPAGHGGVEAAFGILTNIPLAWLALASPFAWRSRSAQATSILRWFVVAAVLFFVICALTICLFSGANSRYEVDFLPVLVLLAVIGVLGLERMLMGQPTRHRAARWCWGVLLFFSVAFNLFASIAYHAFVYNDLGNALMLNGRVQEAIRIHEQALRFDPDYAEAQNSLASELFALGKVQEGSQHFERSLQIRPEWASTHYDWGNALARSEKFEDAISQYQEALRLKPDYPDAHNNLGIALMALGKSQEAIAEYKRALEINPKYPQAYNSLGNAFFQEGKTEDAITQYEKAVLIWPDSADLHYNLGLALEKMGRTPEAIEEYEQVLNLQPDFAAAGNALKRLRAGQ